MYVYVNILYSLYVYWIQFKMSSTKSTVAVIKQRHILFKVLPVTNIKTEKYDVINQSRV